MFCLLPKDCHTQTEFLQAIIQGTKVAIEAGFGDAREHRFENLVQAFSTIDQSVAAFVEAQQNDELGKKLDGAMISFKQVFSLESEGGSAYDTHVADLKCHTCTLLSKVHKWMLESPEHQTATGLLKSSCADADDCKKVGELQRVTEQHLMWARNKDDKSWVQLCCLFATILLRHPVRENVGAEIEGGGTLPLDFFSVLDDVPQMHVLFLGSSQWGPEVENMQGTCTIGSQAAQVVCKGSRPSLWRW